MTFWEGKQIVVTGGAGMIGTPLVRMLLAEGALVAVLDNFSRGQNRVDSACYIKGDAGDLDTCMETFAAADGVFNLAAHVAGILYNEINQNEMLAKNVLLQTVPMVAIKRLGIPCSVQVSSVCVYDTCHATLAKEEMGFEGTPIASNYGYAMAKRIGEMVAKQTPGCVRVRPSNAYGPLDYYGERAHVIPALIERAFEKGEDMRVYGSGREIREFVYSDDVARGLMAAFERGRAIGLAYNLGTNGQTATDIASLARLILGLVKGSATLSFDTSRGGGDLERSSDSRRALAELGWQYQVGLLDGLQLTIEDYRRRHLS